MLRWLFGDDRRPRRPARLAFWVGGSVALGATHLATESEGLQLLVFLVLMLLAMPAFFRQFGTDDGYFATVRDRNVPLRVAWPGFAVAVIWGALVLFAIPEAGLGPWFWFWVIMWPWLEVFAWRVEREIESGAAADWPRYRGLRDIAVFCLAFVPIATAAVLLLGDPLWMALAVGAAAGVGGFVAAALVVTLMRRAAPR